MKRGRYAAAALVLSVAMLILPLAAGCGGEVNATAQDTTPQAATAAGGSGSGQGAQSGNAVTGAGTSGGNAAVTPSGPPFGHDEVKGGASEDMLLRNVSFGDHDGYERIVLEFGPRAGRTDDGIPFYTLKENGPPYSDMMGKEIKIDGNYYLELTYTADLIDLSQPGAPPVYKGMKDFTPGLSIIREMKFVPAYGERSLILLIGLDKQAAFRVDDMTGPSRIIIDVQK